MFKIILFSCRLTLIMKKIFSLFVILLSILGFGQVQNFAELSTGVYEQTTILTDQNQNVIGYTSLFNKGLVNNDQEVQFEYVLMDNNLNKLTNGTFNVQYHKKSEINFNGISFHQQNLYVSLNLFSKPKYEILGQLLLKIDLKTNTVVDKKYNLNGLLEDSYNLENLIKNKASASSYSRDVYYPYLGSSTPSYIHYNLLYNRLNGINIKDENFNSTFEYSIDAKNRSNGYSFKLSNLHRDRAVIYEKKAKSGRFELEQFKIYNYKNGQEITSFVYNNKEVNPKEYYLPNTEFVNDNFTIIGEIKNTAQVDIAESKPSLGIIRSIYNLSGELILEKKVYYNDIFKDLGFSNGRDNKGYKFIVSEFFNYSDNSFSVLLEKQKGDGYITESKNSDYIIANFDSNGNFIDYTVLNKKKNIYETYMFSQENKAEDEVLFFYQENLKDGPNLVINKLIKGKIVQERMPFKTGASYLRFSKAKYGHILITEYNKDDKESSIRIEKLNL